MQSQQKVWEEGSSDAETQQEHQQFTASCSRVVCFLFQHLRSTGRLLFFGLFTRLFSNRKFTQAFSIQSQNYPEKTHTHPQTDTEMNRIQSLISDIHTSVTNLAALKWWGAGDYEPPATNITTTSRNLGIQFDEHLRFERRVAKLAQTNSKVNPLLSDKHTSSLHNLLALTLL